MDKRGHKSHIGAAFVIDSEAGFALDFEVLCNLCVICNAKKKAMTDVDFLRQKDASHKKWSNKF